MLRNFWFKKSVGYYSKKIIKRLILINLLIFLIYLNILIKKKENYYLNLRVSAKIKKNNKEYKNLYFCCLNILNYK